MPSNIWASKKHSEEAFAPQFLCFLFLLFGMDSRNKIEWKTHPKMKGFLPTLP